MLHMPLLPLSISHASALSLICSLVKYPLLVPEAVTNLSAKSEKMRGGWVFQHGLLLEAQNNLLFSAIRRKLTLAEGLRYTNTKYLTSGLTEESSADNTLSTVTLLEYDFNGVDDECFELS